MAPAPAPEQGLQNFSAPTPAPELDIFLLWLRLQLLLIYFLLTLLQTKICYKSLIYVYRKSISITAKPKN